MSGSAWNWLGGGTAGSSASSAMAAGGTVEPAQAGGTDVAFTTSAVAAEGVAPIFTTLATFDGAIDVLPNLGPVAAAAGDLVGMTAAGRHSVRPNSCGEPEISIV